MKPNTKDSILEEFDKKCEIPDCDDMYKCEKWFSKNKSFYEESMYPESMFELDKYEIRKFIKSALTCIEKEAREQVIGEIKETRNKMTDEHNHTLVGLQEHYLKCIDDLISSLTKERVRKGK
jgi:polyribonucleotide nucleotidyltransferase